MTLGWPSSILRQDQFWSLKLLNGKKWKLLIFRKLILPVNSKLLYAINWMRKWSYMSIIGLSLTYDQSVLDIKIITCLSKIPLSNLKPNFIWSLFRIKEQMFVQVVQVKWSRSLYMIKTLQESSSQVPVGRLPWNLVCDSGDSSPLYNVQMMIQGWPWPIFCQGQFWSLMFLYGK